MLSSIKDSVQKVIAADLDSFRAEISFLLLQINASNKNQFFNSNNLFAIDILSTILKLLHAGNLQAERISITSRLKAIKKVEEFINSSETIHTITIPKLIEIAQVSERTLCYAFQEYYGMSPKAYLKAYRLNQLRKTLYFSTRSTNTVKNIANQFGFSHMGQLAHDYQLLFNEKPLATLKK